MRESWPRKKSRLSKANLQAAGASPHGQHAYSSERPLC
jgi:hypothetical protein